MRLQRDSALHGDRQGSIIAVTDQATGTVAAHYEYDAFGKREVLAGDGLQDYGFTGREFDDETEFYYYCARHYDPGVGRFPQSDPLGFAAGDLNLYALAGLRAFAAEKVHRTLPVTPRILE